MTQKKLLRPESLRDHRTDADPPPSPRWRFRFGIGRLLIVIAVIGAVLAGYVWFDRTYWEPFRRSESIRTAIKGMKTRCPPDLTPRQWESAVDWTLNLHGNSLLPFQADARTIRQLEGRLRTKVAGNVDLATIDWIWEEYARVCPGGKNHQRFHEQMLEEIAAVGSPTR